MNRTNEALDKYRRTLAERATPPLSAVDELVAAETEVRDALTRRNTLLSDLGLRTTKGRGGVYVCVLCDRPVPTARLHIYRHLSDCKGRRPTAATPVR